MEKLQSFEHLINKDTIIETDYQESINVLENTTLIIEGQTNRLINNNGGIIIIKGYANRINSFNGKIIIDENGFIDSLYCMCSKIEIKGCIRELVTNNSSIIIKENGHIISISNEDSQFTIDKNTYIKNYGQWGKNASYNIIGEGDHIIQNMTINCGGNNE